jgi:aminobenzoyl-glutamate utilization protein B
VVAEGGVGNGASTDVGDVSWVTPTAGMYVATWVPGTPSHSWQAAAASGASIGAKGLIVAAKTLAITVYDLFKNPKAIAEAKEEFLKRRGASFVYESLIGDRKPPLDFRKPVK